jgi:hypothetical protein
MQQRCWRFRSLEGSLLTCDRAIAAVGATAGATAMGAYLAGKAIDNVSGAGRPALRLRTLAARIVLHAIGAACLAGPQPRHAPPGRHTVLLLLLPSSQMEYDEEDTSASTGRRRRLTVEQAQAQQASKQQQPPAQGQQQPSQQQPSQQQQQQQQPPK